MRGYLTPIVASDDTVSRIAVEEPVAIYRADDDTYRVLVETGGEAVALNVRDVTVSRNKESIPIEVVPERDAIAIHNHANSNPITVESGYKESELDAGDTERVSQDSTLLAGHNTKLRLTVKREREKGQTLSIKELQEIIDSEESGSVIDGVDPAVYASSLAENLRKAGNESANECLKIATDVENLVEGQPVDDEGYEATRERVAEFRASLESRVNQSTLRSVDITENEEWQERIDRIAHRIERLYARGETR